MKSSEKFVSPLLNDQSLLLKDLMKKTQFHVYFQG